MTDPKTSVEIEQLRNHSPAAAKAYAEEWLKKAPDSFEALQFYGLLWAKENNFDKALMYFQRALLHDANRPSIHTNLSNVYVACGEVEKALGHLYQALRLQPFHAEAYNNLGRLLYKQGRLAEAMPHFEKALRLDPNYWEAHYNLAHSLATQNQWVRAATHYEAVIRLFPSHPIAHFNLALIYLVEEKYLEAERHLNKTLELDPHHVEATKRLGEVFLEQGKSQEAFALFKKALDLRPDLADVHHNLAILYLRNGDKSQALFHFAEAFRLDPSNETAAHMIASLSNTTPPSSTPLSYITQLFDQYADHYNEHLKNQLNYQVPTLLRNGIGRCFGNNPKAGRVLDLGCGTGLCGIVFRDLALELVGVDLSPKMIAHATLLGAYDKLIVSDFNEYLRSPLEPFDLIIAADVFVYSSALENIFAKIAQILVAQGRFIFSTETLETGTYRLQSTGRFAHSKEYIEALAKKNHFFIELSESIILREGASPISGHLYILKLVASV